MRGPMRYRRLSYRYAMVVRPGRPGSFDDFRQTDRVRLLAEDCWHPDADTYETARTHLRRIFSKTGTSRQAELILLIARHPVMTTRNG